MKRKLLSMAVAFVCSVGAWAVNGSELTATTTDCFLYNVGAEQYLTAGDWWGTHATIGAAGMDLDLTKISDGVYTIGTRQAGSRFLSGVWMDGTSFNFTFAEVDDKNHYYTISWDDNGTLTYLYYTGSTVDATTTAPSNNAYYWQVVSRADFIASLSGATSANPKDATGAIYNAGFFCLDYATAKTTDFPATRSWQGTQLTDTWGYRANEAGVNGANYCVEQAGKSFDNYQTITGILNGAYILKNQGFYRGDKATYLYANNQKAALTQITAAYDAPEGYTGNDLQRSSYAIGIQDMYHNTAPTVIVTDGTLRVGVTSNGESIDWSCFDNFTLSYLGVPSASNPIDLTNSPQNMTNKITNADCEDDGDVAWNGTVSGWSYTTGASNHGTLNDQTGAFTGHAFENWRNGGLNDGKIYQTLTDLPDGVYKFDLAALVRTAKNQKVYATSNGVTYATTVTAAEATAYSVYAIAEGGTMEVGLDINHSGIDWCAIDNAALTYYGTSAEAYALVHAQELAKVSSILSSMSSSSLKTAIQALYDANSSASTVSGYITAINNLNPLSNFNAEIVEANTLCVAADNIAAVAYEETTTGSHATFTDAISTFSTAVTGATSTSTITTAVSTLTSAIKTYISSAEPANEGEYFDITCLMTNPGFDNNTTEGWICEAGVTATRVSCNEFFQKSFDIYQTVTGLPTGSYTLSVQAFQRPGAAQTVYSDYMNGTNNATTLLYVNSTTAKAKHIAADASPTKLYTDDSEVSYNEENKYLPNSMEGARVYFDAGLYDATVAALVDESDGGSLKLGFKSESYVTSDWTIFDNFRLYYYGSSKMIYYKQYLLQLEAEIAENYLNNNAYNVLQTGQTERTALATANSADADELNTESELQAAITAITTARDNFEAAKTSYDNLNSAITTATSYASNVGTGVFQITEAAGVSLSNEATTAQTMYTTGTASMSDVYTETSTLNTTVTTATATLNAPEAGSRYYIKVATANHAKIGNAIAIGRKATYPVYNGNYISDQTGFTFKASAAPANYMAQAVTFTQVESNTYNIAFEREEGTVYMTYGSLNDSKVTWKESQIQGTTESAKKGTFKIVPTTTANVFNIYNTILNTSIACQNNNDGSLYTETGNAEFALAEATEASVTVTAKAGKFGTTILPFTPDVSTGFDGVTFYSCEEVNAETSKVKLTEVVTPAANVPYIIKNNGTNDFSKELSGWGIATADSYSNGLLTGVYTAAIIAASIEPTDESAGSYNYVLQTADGVQAFYKVSNDFTATANKCYLTVPMEATGSYGAKAFYLDLSGADGISHIDSNTTTYSTIFNLAGQRLQNAQKGINIIDGKKVLLK